MNSRKPGLFDNWSDAFVFCAWLACAYLISAVGLWVAWAVTHG